MPGNNSRRAFGLRPLGWSSKTPVGSRRAFVSTKSALCPFTPLAGLLVPQKLRSGEIGIAQRDLHIGSEAEHRVIADAHRPILFG